MLSDTPPERDIEWTEAGVEGSWRFVQRVWRLVNDIAERTHDAVRRPETFPPAGMKLRRASHQALNLVSGDIEGLRFNRAIARIYDLANTLSAALAETWESEAVDWAAREAAEILTQVMSPMMPHLAEECWKVLGRQSTLAETVWPTPEPALLVQDIVTIAVQVNGRRRAELGIAKGASNSAVEAEALKLDNVRRAIEGKPVRKVIVVPDRIVNVVTG
jgi:leucyl-tRNA synthetase